MYITTRYYYPNGIEGEAMKCTIKEFDTFEKAVSYCERYTKGIRFAGVTIENEQGYLLYEITSDMRVYRY
jgi:hypothetical protein